MTLKYFTNNYFVGTENVYLRVWFNSQKAETHAFGMGLHQNPYRSSDLTALPALPGRQDSYISQDETVNTPRRSQIIDAGWRTIARGMFP